MKPGGELDALVAEKVMGWSQIPLTESKDENVRQFISLKEFLSEEGWQIWRRPDTGREWVVWHENSPARFSTNIAAAWEVVEKMHESPTHRICLYGKEGGSHSMVCSFSWKDGGSDFGCQINLLEARASTAPHAICLAALKAVGADLSTPVQGRK
jgi:hypothetical protein